MVKAFRSYKDMFHVDQPEDNAKLVLVANRNKDARTHNMPTSSEVAALIPGDFPEGMDKRDIVLETIEGKLRRISELYVGYLTLQYPLLFPYGEDGFQVGIEDGFDDGKERKRKTISMREFYAFHIQDRLLESQAVIRSKRLYQQYLVDVYTMIEFIRLRYLRKNQKKLRSDKYVNLEKVANDGNSDLSNNGKRILIPASFTGGPRYMNNNYLDAMAICKHFGFPDLFITFTCNPSWPEIVRYTKKRNLKPEDRPDICCRIFKMKLESLMSDLTEKNIFGKSVCGMYTIEFQKRGLPHAHILLWMAQKHKFPTPEAIDEVISAEIPDKDTDPYLYEVVKKKHDSWSMWSDQQEFTMKTDAFVEKNGLKIDNSFVVPYNRELSLRYRAHINVEWCTQARSIKYVSACEAAWRLLAFLIHFRTTPVEKLYFHLENEQSVLYDDDDPVETVLNRRSIQTSMFLAFFEACNKYPEAEDLTYAEFPTMFVYDRKKIEWKPRQQKNRIAVGRLTYVPVSCGQLYYLRVLLNIRKCPKGFNDLKTVDGVLYPSYKEACYAMGLLDDDKEYIDGITEASNWGTGFFLRRLFAIMLLTDCLINLGGVWEETWHLLSEDIVYRRRSVENNPDLTLDDQQLKNLTLDDVESILRSNGSSLANYDGMPIPDSTNHNPAINRLLFDERNYDKAEMAAIHDSMLPGLTDEQRKVFSEIMEAVTEDKGGVFFVYGFGGTGKTHLWKILSAAIRSKGQIFLNVASTDLAELVAEASLIIWDEAPMMSRYCFESLDRSMRDIIRRHEDKPFGGKVVVFGGDFRQILPVISGGDLDEGVAQEIKSFSEWILKVGDGKINLPNTGEVSIDIPEELLIKQCDDPVNSIIEAVYGLGFEDQNDPNFYQDRAILCPTNAMFPLSTITCEEKTYLSSDSIDPSDTSNQDSRVHTPDFLNNIKVSGLPNHSLTLKVGAPVMLLRNIDPKGGLCNGTRLQITQLADHVIEAIILTGETHGQKVFIPRLNVSPPEDLHPGQTNWTIRVKVLKKWHVKHPSQRHSLQFMLMDEEAETIQAFLYIPDLIKSFDMLIEEVDLIDPIEVDTPHGFLKFSDVLGGKTEPGIPIDIMGFVVNIEPLVTVTDDSYPERQDKKTASISFTIKDDK
ncbi:uncharacterized protein LOC112088437 [Eutrema salsugineum]|uniref:uncharacterized protein LOC112088437 n=1 Tax=Eutrema salsugineum TaxID=72664 RepID=UPI000CED3E86|nr:uncharacterized protein LOC112088437 [Eutrema salsugineum]